MSSKYKSFYCEKTLKGNIKNIYYKDFIECLFSNKVYLCEGINDKLFLLKALNADGKLFDDYYIFQTFGKFTMPIFEKIFSSLGISTEVIFDEDTSERKTIPLHDEIDSYLESLNHYMFIPSLEDEIKYTGKKFDFEAFITHLDSFNFIAGKYLK